MSRYCRFVGAIAGIAVAVVVAAACTAANSMATPDMSDLDAVVQYYKTKGFDVEVQGPVFGEVDVNLQCTDNRGPTRSFAIDGDVGAPLVAEVTSNGPGADTYTTKSYRFTRQPTKDEVARDNLCGGDQPAPPTPTVESASAPPSGASTFSEVEQSYRERGFNVVPLGYLDGTGVWLDLKCRDHRPRWFKFEWQPGDPLSAVRTSRPDPNTLVTKQFTFEKPPSPAEIAGDKLCADGPPPARVWNVPQIEKGLLAAHFDVVAGSAQRYSSGITFRLKLGCANGVEPTMYVVAQRTGDDSVPPDFDPDHAHLSNPPADQGHMSGDFSKQPTKKEIDEYALCSS